MTARKPVAKPPMSEAIRPFVDKARERHMRRPPTPGVRVTGGKPEGWAPTSPHRDLDAWEIQIAEAFGTRSESAYRTFLGQLAQLCSPAAADLMAPWSPNERELNAALAIVSGMKPKNEMQAAQAAQIVAIHLLTMQTASKALQAGWTDHRTIAVAAALARTFTAQIDTMAKLKGRTGRQKISVKVERHIHHHEHQHLHTDREGGGSEFGGRPQTPATRVLSRKGAVPALEPDQRPALSGPDPERDAVPGPCGEGPSKVQASRVLEGVGRPAGRAERRVQDRAMVERGCRVASGRVGGDEGG